MKNNFDKMIKDIEREMLALKTAYSRGLGVADFFTINKSDEITIDHSGQYVYITADFAPPEDGGVPFAQCYLSAAYLYRPVRVRWDGVNNKLVYTFAAYFSQATVPITARIVSSSYITSVTIGVGI